MEQLTLLSPEPPARTFPSPENAQACPGSAADWPWLLRKFFQLCARNGSSGKTYPEFFPQTADGTSGHSSGRWTTSGIHARGECLTLSISESPRDAAECSLSDILETGDLPRRYFLSAKACVGIFKRDGLRGECSLVSRQRGELLSMTERHMCWIQQALGELPRLNGKD